ncbi:adenosylmethionine decarboxylase [Candidatus Pacearchaeota archaeon CG06_land_8_20_14_3_00_35_12]|nr:MAG: adenosylmethionine decarboxylase [Candidatus Pacearchaeota archaeon CG06_land_8_20_14_3_00_35_12]
MNNDGIVNGNHNRRKYSMTGTHVICDMYGIKNIAPLTDKDSIEKILNGAVRASGAHAIATITPDYFIKKKYGLTSAVFVKESIFDIHCYPEQKGAVLDIYTCGGRAKPVKGLKYIKKKLEPGIMNVLVIKRGNVKNLEIGQPPKKLGKKPFGYSLVIDAYDCHPKKVLNDMDLAYDFLESLPEVLGFKEISTPYLSRKKGGGLIGGIDLAGHNSVDINTSVSKQLLLLDVFSTKKFDFKTLRKELIKNYKPGDIDEQWLQRGVDYLP